MEKTKIQLSPEELLLMQNSDWILTKNSVINKISQGFGSLASRMREKIASLQLLPEEDILLCTPKISRGEKYEGLPYVMLDYPRIFGKEHILAIRTLFWWGNYCSVTLHVKGNYQELIQSRLKATSDQFIKSTFYVSFSGDEWNHDLTHEDYNALQYLSSNELEKKLAGSNFLKLTAKVEIGPWDSMEKKLFDFFSQLLELIKA